MVELDAAETTPDEQLAEAHQALVQSLAAEVSKRQLLAGQDPLALIDRLNGQYIKIS